MMYLFIGIFIASIFIVDGVKRTWRYNEWKRRWKNSA
jgi:hypothetical protein